MSPLRIEEQEVLPAGWCWGGHVWLIAGLPDFREGGLMHGRDGCWERDRAVPVTGLDRLSLSFGCCPHCPCTGRQHTTACPVEGCHGQVGS